MWWIQSYYYMDGLQQSKTCTLMTTAKLRRTFEDTKKKKKGNMKLKVVKILVI